MVIIIVMFTHQVGQLQESIDLLNRKLSEAEAAHQVLLYLKWFWFFSICLLHIIGYNRDKSFYVFLDWSFHPNVFPWCRTFWGTRLDWSTILRSRATPCSSTGSTKYLKDSAGKYGLHICWKYCQFYQEPPPTGRNVWVWGSPSQWFPWPPSFEVKFVKLSLNLLRVCVFCFLRMSLLCLLEWGVWIAF